MTNFTLNKVTIITSADGLDGLPEANYTATIVEMLEKEFGANLSVDVIYEAVEGSAASIELGYNTEGKIQDEDWMENDLAFQNETEETIGRLLTQAYDLACRRY